MTPTNLELRQFVVQNFSDEELERLRLDYFPEVSADLGGDMPRSRKAIALVGHCEHHGRLNDLHAALARERPEAWSRIFSASPAENPDFSEETRFPQTRDPRQIFLSYAAADAEFAYTLAGDLRAEGWPVWIAPESIRPGEKWVEAINRGLETSGVFVVVLTPAAVTSSWVNTEADAAVEIQHEGLITFIPLDVIACRPKLLWRQYQYVPFRSSYEVGLDALLRRLDNRLPVETFRRNVSTPPPPPPPPRGRYVKEEQWRQLQALAHEIAAGLGQQSGNDETREVYRRFNRHFGLTTYKKLPRRRFDEGLAFLTAWRDEIAASLSPDRYIHEKTGIEFIRIPAGPFRYGSSDADEMARDDEKPQRAIDLPEYWIGRYPLTNTQFDRFVRATNYRTTAEEQGFGWVRTGNTWADAKGANWRHPGGPITSIDGKDDHPVVQVSWHDVKAFCDWAELALPTEMQWEKAARGTNGRIWPWGEDPPTAEQCNFSFNVGDTTPVGHYSPKGDSPYGCADMAGNVWEWTTSEYRPYPYDPTDGREEAGDAAARRVLRGGSWRDYQYRARGAYRIFDHPYDRYFDVGCRLVYWSPSTPPRKGKGAGSPPASPPAPLPPQASPASSPTARRVEEEGQPRRLAEAIFTELSQPSGGEKQTAQPPFPKGEGAGSLVSDRRIHEKTGIELIRIPAGSFPYGEVYKEKTIDLPEYWIGRTPVTNAQYKRFLDANPWRRARFLGTSQGRQVPFQNATWAQPYNWDEKTRSYPAGKADHPVVLVSWDDAKAFCDWAGLALPSEEQWEKAARGPYGRKWPWEPDDRIWPWGADDRELWWRENRVSFAERCNFMKNVGGTTPVGHYSPKGDSPYGCADMAGNVWEWTGAWYTEGKTRVMRGGSWDDPEQSMRPTFRIDFDPHSSLFTLGFRVVEILSDPKS